MQEIIVELPKLLLDKTSRRFFFNEKGLMIEDCKRPGRVVDIPIHAIQSFRFGVKWIRGLQFIVGRHFFIELKDSDNQVIAIKFSSYYGFRKKAYTEIYQNLINTVWDHYFTYQLNYYVELYNNHEAFSLNHINFTADGISWDGKRLLPWKEIALKTYISYFAVRDVNDGKFHKSFTYMTDWNAFLLKALLDRIVKGRRISESEVS